MVRDHDLENVISQEVVPGLFLEKKFALILQDFQKKKNIVFITKIKLVIIKRIRKWLMNWLAGLLYTQYKHTDHIELVQY